MKALLYLRGALVSGPPDAVLATTGCLAMPTEVDFFYDAATLQTYHQCFSDPAVNPTTPTPTKVLNSLFVPPDSGLVLAGENDGRLREYAIDAMEQFEGA